MIEVAIVHTILAEGRRSAEIYAHELSQCLESEHRETVNISHVRDIRVSRPMTRLGRYTARYVRYQLAVRRTRADVYHLVDHGYGHLALGLPPGRVAVTFFDGLLYRLAEGAVPRAGYSSMDLGLARIGLRMSERGIRRSRAVIAVSHTARLDAEAKVGVAPSRIRDIPLGVSDAFHPGPRRDDSLRPQLLHVGSSVPYKNIETLIRCLSTLKETSAMRPTLLKVGSELTNAQWDLARDLGVNDDIQVREELTLAELAAAYRQASVLVMPSLYEGFGLPALEAMASGLPVVVSDRGALPEVVDGAGVVVSPDAGLLAAAVIEVLTNRELAAELQRRGPLRAAEFSWSKVADKTAVVYSDMA